MPTIILTCLLIIKILAKPLNSYEPFEEVVSSAHNHVVEDIFCLVFPILDALFVEMGAVSDVNVMILDLEVLTDLLLDDYRDIWNLDKCWLHFVGVLV